MSTRLSRPLRVFARAATSRLPGSPMPRRTFLLQAAPRRRAITPAAATRLSIRGFSNVTENVPSLGDSISDAVVVEYTKNVGDFIQADEVYVVLETDKVSVDVRAGVSGVITAFHAEVNDTVNVGQPIIEITPGGAPASAPAPAAAAPAPAAAPTPAPSPAAAPAAAPTPRAATPQAPTPAAAAKLSSPASNSTGRAETSVPLTRMRLTIANRLKDAQNSAAMLTTFNEVDMSEIMSLRNKYKDEFEKTHGIKMGFMSAFVKASSHALIKNPAVNAFFDMQNKCITYRNYTDISVAVATPTGLVVPVLRDTHSMTFAGVETAIAAMGKKARAGQIAMEDMVGGTFTISNGGVYGSLMGTPIINPPQSAILGMHGIFKRPIVVNDEIVIRPMMYIALTYDHRIIDGKDAVTFLKDVKNCVEDPARMLLDM